MGPQTERIEGTGLVTAENSTMKGNGLVNLRGATVHITNQLKLLGVNSVDFGTATTFDVVGSGGEYLGGAISPGLNLSLKSLHEMTAQLPKINVKAQKNVIGKNTIEAMNSGVYFGYIAMIEGMVNRIENELGTKTRKIITGGLAEIFKTALCIDTTEEDFIKQPISNYFFHSPNLTVEGLEMLYHKLY